MHTEQRQKNKVKKVRSIGTRMTIIFSAVLIVALAACWVANIFFLQDYYIKNKLMAIKEAYEYMDEASKADNLSRRKISGWTSGQSVRPIISVCLSWIKMDGQG